MNGSDFAATAWNVFGPLAVQTCAIVGIAVLVQHSTNSRVWHRTVWQCSILALCIAFALEATGTRHRLNPFALSDSAPLPPTHSDINKSPEALSLREDFRNKINQALDRSPTAPHRSDRASTTSPTWLRGPNASLQEPALHPTDSVETLFLSLPHHFWLIGIWLFGSLLLLARIGVGQCLLLLLQRRGRIPADQSLEAYSISLAQPLGFKRHFRLIASQNITTPIAFGLFHPTIAVPLDFHRAFSTNEQESMLAHELAHLAANDQFWRLICQFTTAALWWHPLVWLARSRWEWATETAADDTSSRIAHGPGVLADSLVKTGIRLAQRSTSLSLGIRGNQLRSSLGRRVELLLSLRKPNDFPPPPVKLRMAQIFGSIALLGIGVISAGWSSPQPSNQEPIMKTWQQNWKRTITTAAFILSASSVNTPVIALDQPKSDPPTNPPPAPSESQKVQPSPNTSSSKTDANPSPAPSSNPNFRMSPELMKRYGLHPSPQSNGAPAIYKMDPELMKRYGLLPTTESPSAAPKDNPERHFKNPWKPGPEEAAPPAKDESVETTLKSIILEEVFYDSIPLMEVIKDLQSEARKRDPKKRGVNFLLSRIPEPSANSTEHSSLDPTTGQPISQNPADFEFGNVIVRINPALRHVRLKDVLDAITRVAEQPVEYSVKPYGVVFYPAARSSTPQAAGFNSSQLLVRTFRVETNTFLSGLERAFGIKARSQTSDGPSRGISETLRFLFTELGMDLRPQNKLVIYNDVHGMLLVRGTEADLQIVQAAIETLGGQSTPEDTPAR